MSLVGSRTIPEEETDDFVEGETHSPSVEQYTKQLKRASSYGLSFPGQSKDLVEDNSQSETPPINPLHLLSQSIASQTQISSSSDGPVSTSDVSTVSGEESFTEALPGQKYYIHKVTKEEVQIRAGEPPTPVSMSAVTTTAADVVNGTIRNVGGKMKKGLAIVSGGINGIGSAGNGTGNIPGSNENVAGSIHSGHSGWAPPSPPPSDHGDEEDGEISPTTSVPSNTAAPHHLPTPGSFTVDEHLSPRSNNKTLPSLPQIVSVASSTSLSITTVNLNDASSNTTIEKDEKIIISPTAPLVDEPASMVQSPATEISDPYHSFSLPTQTAPNGASVAVQSSTSLPAPASSPRQQQPVAGLLHPLQTSAPLHPPSPLRRNTTGTSSTSSGSQSPHRRRPSNSSLNATSPTSKQLYPLSLTHSGGNRSDRTAVPGVENSELDSDILAQAEIIRKERLSRRARRKFSDSDGGSFVGGGSFSSSIRRPLGSFSADAHGANLAGGDGFAGPSNQGQTQLKKKASEKKSQLEEARVLVGNLIGEDHVNYVLMYNMLTGIRIGVSRCQAKISRPLTDEDFTARHKFSFDIVGNELTPSAKYDFKFKDYAPWVFRKLRDEQFCLDPADYLLSLTAKYILSELGSPGKSGSFFYFSRDYRFIIKTISHTEHKFLRSILKDYYEHVANNPNTLLSRFYGLHRVKLPRGRKIHFVIMNNLFPPHRDIHETYDLKGSYIGREYDEAKAAKKKGAVLKDINWARRDRTLQLGPEKKALLSEQLRRDSEFLKKMKIMDYSLLIGIHNISRGNRDNLRENTLHVFDPNATGAMRRKPSQAKGVHDIANLRRQMQAEKSLSTNTHTSHLSEADTSDRKHFLFYQDEGGLQATNEYNQAGDVIYYLGVIDICTPYSFVKKIEHMWKSFTQDSHGISAVPPNEYGDRFYNFMLSCMPGNAKLRSPGLTAQSIREKDKEKREKMLAKGGKELPALPLDHEKIGGSNDGRATDLEADDMQIRQAVKPKTE